jgi:hypothetical protein
VSPKTAPLIREDFGFDISIENFLFESNNKKKHLQTTNIFFPTIRPSVVGRKDEMTCDVKA